MSNKKKLHQAAAEAAARENAAAGGKPRPAPPTYAERKRYMLIAWLCTLAVGFIVYGHLRVTGEPPSVMHYILLGLMLLIALSMTQGFVRALAAAREDKAPRGKRSKG